MFTVIMDTGFLVIISVNSPLVEYQYRGIMFLNIFSCCEMTDHGDETTSYDAETTSYGNSIYF